MYKLLSKATSYAIVGMLLLSPAVSAKDLIRTSEGAGVNVTNAGPLTPAYSKKADQLAPTQKQASLPQFVDRSTVTNSAAMLATRNNPDKLLISLDSNTDYNQIALILLAIFTVIGTTCVSIRTINKKTEESIRAHDAIVKSQTEIAELNNRTQVLSNNRQAWINTLREEIAQYLADLHILQFEKLLGNERDKTNCSLALKNAYSRRNKIQLLINPEESDHQQLVAMVYDALTATSKTVEELCDIEANIIMITQKILKREWIRVKAVE
jgi:hypothetical protein